MGLIASMRPPHYTGEDGSTPMPWTRRSSASMRPPHYTGEDGKDDGIIYAGCRVLQ